MTRAIVCIALHACSAPAKRTPQPEPIDPIDPGPTETQSMFSENDPQPFLCDGQRDCTRGFKGNRSDPEAGGSIECPGCFEIQTAYCFAVRSDEKNQHQWHSVCSPTLRECESRSRATHIVMPCGKTSGSYFIPNE